MSIFIYDERVKYCMLSILCLFALIALLYWWYHTTLGKKDESSYIRKIIAISKDGYEKEISRIKSKRNLFNFIKFYMTKGTDSGMHPEDFWWKRAVYHKRKEIEESFQQFILNNAPKQEQEDFAYEGIFDKNNEKENTPSKPKMKRLESNFMVSMNKTNAIMDEYRMTNNASGTLNNHEETSDYSRSPNSSTSRAFAISKSSHPILLTHYSQAEDPEQHSSDV